MHRALCLWCNVKPRESLPSRPLQPFPFWLQTGFRLQTKPEVPGCTMPLSGACPSMSGTHASAKVHYSYVPALATSPTKTFNIQLIPPIYILYCIKGRSHPQTFANVIISSHFVFHVLLHVISSRKWRAPSIFSPPCPSLGVSLPPPARRRLDYNPGSSPAAPGRVRRIVGGALWMSHRLPHRVTSDRTWVALQTMIVSREGRGLSTRMPCSLAL